MRTDEPSNQAEPLQFDRAELMAPGAGTSAVCAACKQAIASSYYEIGGGIYCEACCEQVSAALQGGSAAARFFKALIFGLVTAAACSAGWLLIVKVTGYELGIIAIVVGAAIGVVVRKGASHRGGWVYQGMAILLTYFSITASYVPDVIHAMTSADAENQSQLIQSDRPRLKVAIFRDGSTRMNGKESSTEEIVKELDRMKAENGFVMYFREARRELPPPPSADIIGNKWTELEIPVAYCTDAECQNPDDTPFSFAEVPLVGKVLMIVAAFTISLMLPFLGLPANIIGLLIICIALWEAWKLNRRLKIEISGPHFLAERPVPDRHATATHGAAGETQDHVRP